MDEALEPQEGAGEGVDSRGRFGLRKESRSRDPPMLKVSSFRVSIFASFVAVGEERNPCIFFLKSLSHRIFFVYFLLIFSFLSTSDFFQFF